MKLRKLSDLILSTAVQFESRLLDLLLEDGDLLPDPLGHLAVLRNSIAINHCPLNKRTFLGATNNCSTYSVIESHYLHHLVVKVTDTLLYIIAIISHLFSQTKIGCRSYRCYNYTLPPPVTLIAQPGSQTTITYAVLQLSRFCLHSSA